ncbi:unnamed protein product [Amoebophrya sp. A120]|nr:unnamed protein product [Amoebophrya sp. A120]|eukprot:GSA120T00020592001.1
MMASTRSDFKNSLSKTVWHYRTRGLQRSTSTEGIRGWKIMTWRHVALLQFWSTLLPPLVEPAAPPRDANVIDIIVEDVDPKTLPTSSDANPVCFSPDDETFSPSVCCNQTFPVSSKTSGREHQSDLSQQSQSAPPRDDVVSSQRQRRRPCWSYPLDEKTCCVPSREKTGDEEKDGQRAHCFDGSLVTRARCCAQATEISRSIRDDAITNHEATSGSGTQFQDALAKAMDEQEAAPEINVEKSEGLEDQRDHGVEVNAVPEWLRAGIRPVMLNIFGKNEPNPHALQLLSDNALTETVQRGLWSAHLEMLRGVFGEILVQWNAVSSSNTTTEDLTRGARGSSATTSTDRTHAPPADHEQRRSEQNEEQAVDGVEEYEGRATELALQEHFFGDDHFFALSFLFGPKGVERTIPRGGDEMFKAVLLLRRLAKRKAAAALQEATDKKLKDAFGDEDDKETHPLLVATPLEYNFWTSDLKSSSGSESLRSLFAADEADDVVSSDEKGRGVRSRNQLPNTHEKRDERMKGWTLPLDRVNPEEYERSPLFVYEKLQKCSRHFGWALVEIKFRIADFFFHHILRIKAALELGDLQRSKNDTASGLKNAAHTTRTLLSEGAPARFLRKMWASSQGPRAPVRGEDADTHVVCLPVGFLSTMTSADQDLDQRGLFAMFRLYILPLWLFWQRDSVQEKFLRWFRSFTVRLEKAEHELHIDASLSIGRASRGASTPPIARAVLQSLPGTTKKDGHKSSYSHFIARLAEKDATAEDVAGQVTTTVLEFVDVRLLRMTSLRAYDLYQQALTRQWIEKQKGHAHTKSMLPSSDDALPPTTNASPRNDEKNSAGRRFTSTANDESRTRAHVPPPHSNDRSTSSLSVAVCISGGVRGFTQKPVYESIRNALTSLKAKKVRVFYQFDLSRVTKLGIGDHFDIRHHSSSSEQKQEQLRDQINNREQEDLRRAIRAVEEELHGGDERNSGAMTADVKTASVEALSSSSWTAAAFQQIDHDTKSKCLSDQVTCPIMGLQRDFCRRSIHEYERQVEDVSSGSTSVSAVNEMETKITDTEATGLELFRRSEFDWVLFTRPDLFLQPLGDLRRFDPAFIHAPTNTLWGCISCKLALVPRKFLDLYVDSYRLGGDQRNAFACYPRKSETVTETFAGQRGTDCGCTLWKALRTCKAAGREQLLSKSTSSMSKDREHEQDYTWQTLKQAEATRTHFAKNLNSEPTGPAAALLSDELQTVCGNPDAIKVPKYRSPVADDAEEKELQTSASILDPPLLMPVEQAMTATVTRGGLWRPDWDANMAWFR